jgi:hypothetical protein
MPSIWITFVKRRIRESWLSLSRRITSKAINNTLTFFRISRPESSGLLLTTKFYLVLFVFGVTIAAVYRLVTAGLKRNFGLFAATPTSGGIHLARAAAETTASAAFITKTLIPSGWTARRATLGFIGEAFGVKKLLFFSREGERFSAIGTSEGFFCISH